MRLICKNVIGNKAQTIHFIHSIFAHSFHGKMMCAALGREKETDLYVLYNVLMNVWHGMTDTRGLHLLYYASIQTRVFGVVDLKQIQHSRFIKQKCCLPAYLYGQILTTRFKYVYAK